MCTGRVKHYSKSNVLNGLNTNDIFAIKKTTGNTLWIGTIHGLLQYSYDTDDFRSVPQLEGCCIYDILEDYQNNIWVATYANGAYRYDIHNDTWKFFRNDPNDPSSLPYNKVTDIYEDSNRQLWFLTQGGGFVDTYLKTIVLFAIIAKMDFQATPSTACKRMIKKFMAHY